MRVEPGANWKEANTTLQKIMEEYVGTKVRSESLLTAGRKYICDLRGYAEEKLQADNSHELMRCLEVLASIYFCGKTKYQRQYQRYQK